MKTTANPFSSKFRQKNQIKPCDEGEKIGVSFKPMWDGLLEHSQESRNLTDFAEQARRSRREEDPGRARLEHSSSWSENRIRVQWNRAANGAWNAASNNDDFFLPNSEPPIYIANFSYFDNLLNLWSPSGPGVEGRFQPFLACSKSPLHFPLLLVRTGSKGFISA